MYYVILMGNMQINYITDKKALSVLGNTDHINLFVCNYGQCIERKPEGNISVTLLTY